MHHPGQGNEPKTTGSDMCMVENRDIENFSNLESWEVAEHVWKTCKPSGSFMTKSPTVSARRVQLMRVYLQNFVPDPEPEPDPCKKRKSPPPAARMQGMCPCGNMNVRGFEEKAASPAANSLTDVMYAFPKDKDGDAECCEDEDEDEDEDEHCGYE